MIVVDIVQIINVVGPLLIQLVEILLKYFFGRPDREEKTFQAVLTIAQSGVFEDEFGTRFEWEPNLQPQFEAFLRGIIAAKAQALG